MRGIEPPYSAWEADVLPLNYTRWCSNRSVRSHDANRSRPRSGTVTHEKATFRCQPRRNEH